MTHFSPIDCPFCRFHRPARLAMALRCSPFSPRWPRPVPPTPAAAGPGAYDGTWNVVFATRRGQLQFGPQRPVHGLGQPGFVGGRRQGLRRHQPRRGGCRSRFQVGASQASGSGRLVGSSAARGRWSGIITGDRCSGTLAGARGAETHDAVPGSASAQTDLCAASGTAKCPGAISDGPSHRCRSRQISAAPAPSRPGGLRNARPARPWRIRRRRP